MRDLPETGVIHGVPISRRSDGTYVCEGSFCVHNRLACALAWLMREHERGPASDPLLSSSSSHLYNMHAGLYRDWETCPLVPAADYRLLDQNGGSMTSDEYDRYTSRAWVVSRAPSASPMSPAPAVTRTISYLSTPAVEKEPALAHPLYVTASAFIVPPTP